MEVMVEKWCGKFMEVVPCIEYDSIFQVRILLQQSRQCYLPVLFVDIRIRKPFAVAAVDEVPLLNRSMVSNKRLVVEIVHSVHCILTTLWPCCSSCSCSLSHFPQGNPESNHDVPAFNLDVVYLERRACSARISILKYTLPSIWGWKSFGKFVNSLLYHSPDTNIVLLCCCRTNRSEQAVGFRRLKEILVEDLIGCIVCWWWRRRSIRFCCSCIWFSGS